jgi:ABC-type sugar transport system substrate-binding protein
MEIEKTEETDSPMRIGILLGDRSNPFWTEMEYHYTLLAPGMGMAVEHFRADLENDRQGQLDVMFAMIGKGFDAIVINPISNSNLVPAIAKATTLGIPVLDVGAKTDGELLRGVGPMYIPVRTVDFFEQGILGGNYICEKLRQKEGGKVAIIEGRPDSAQSIGRSAGAACAFGEAGPSIHLVARKTADFDRSLAGHTALAILDEEPLTAAFFCANAAMAIGVAEKVREKGNHLDTIIVGVDFTGEIAGAVRNGVIDATVAFSPAEVARIILETAEGTRTGGRPSEQFLVTSTLVTRENIDSYGG